MYEQFFGLREAPFELTPNPRFLFLSPRHREALGNLTYAVRAQKGITLLLGEAGTGKTTILRAFLLSKPDPGSRFVYVENPALTRPEFYQLLAGRLGFSAGAATSKAQFLLETEASIAVRRGRDPRIVLIFDEAQALPPGLLEEVRLLSNIETESEKLLSIVLAGQPELGELLEKPEFQPLKQRTCLRCELLPFDLPDTAAYIGGRLRIAGGDPARIFTREAVILIHEVSRGIARTISVVCDNAMVTAFAADVRPIGPDIVDEVCQDFRLSNDTRHPASGLSSEGGLLRTSPAVTKTGGKETARAPEMAHPRRGRFSLSNFLPGRSRMTTLGMQEGRSADED
jgi:general secretion pathway protein A